MQLGDTLKNKHVLIIDSGVNGLSITSAISRSNLEKLTKTYAPAITVTTFAPPRLALLTEHCFPGSACDVNAVANHLARVLYPSCLDWGLKPIPRETSFAFTSG